MQKHFFVPLLLALVSAILLPAPLRAENKPAEKPGAPVAAPATPAAPASPITPAAGKQVALTFTAKVNGKDESLGYFLYLPKDYDQNKDKQPLLIFLHGSGERGSDINRVKVHGPPKLVDKGQHMPFIVVSPQCPEKISWNVDVLKAMIEQLGKDHRVDADRIYMTGLSMGGFGTWHFCCKYPNLIAAAVPICGGGDPSKAGAMKNIPTWVFHGDLDRAVNIQKSKDMVEAMKKAGGEPKFTIYEGVGHDSWVKAYASEELYEWLIKQKRGK